MFFMAEKHDTRDRREDEGKNIQPSVCVCEWV